MELEFIIKRHRYELSRGRFVFKHQSAYKAGIKNEYPTAIDQKYRRYGNCRMLFLPLEAKIMIKPMTIYRDKNKDYTEKTSVN